MIIRGAGLGHLSQIRDPDPLPLRLTFEELVLTPRNVTAVGAVLTALHCLELEPRNTVCLPYLRESASALA